MIKRHWTEINRKGNTVGLFKALSNANYKLTMQDIEDLTYDMYVYCIMPTITLVLLTQLF